mmetsp:Transcript_15759/g.33532  ORF Transcript_15759/g.33532 Transcript_15759/m.33532 type:complete len:289 (-) Transcript_15759:1073-1939(-)
MHLQHGQRLDDLGVERVGRLEQVEQLAVVHLEEHAGDLAGELRLDVLDEREKALAQELLLLLGRRGGEGGSVDLSRRHRWRRTARGPLHRLHGHAVRRRSARLALATWAALPASGAALRTLLEAAALLLHVALLGLAAHRAALRPSLRPAALLRAPAAVAHGHGAVVAHLAHGLVHARARAHHHLLRVHEAAGALRLWGHLLRRIEKGSAWVHLRLRLRAAREADAARDALRVLLLEHVLALVLALRERDVEWLVTQNVAVHLGDRLGRLLRRAKTHKAKAPRDALVV